MIIGVVGTGVIGRSWAALFLSQGHDVIAMDPAPEAETATRAAIDAAWPSLERLGTHPSATPDRLTFVSTVAEAVTEADFVQESGPETPHPKAALLAEVDGHTPKHVVVASSSSGIMPSQLQSMCPHHPHRVLVGHPFNPAHLIPLVEVVGNADTAAWAVDAAIELYTTLGKKPIRVRTELPGHIANRLQAALWREAYSLVASGAASVSDVDAAVSHGPGLRWALLGPLVNQHLSGGAGGLDHVLRHLGPAADAWMDDLGDVRMTPALASELVAGVSDELAGISEQDLVQVRDGLLITLLEQKAGTDLLP